VPRQRECSLLFFEFFLPKRQFANRFNKNNSIWEDINIQLHSNTVCTTVAKTFN
jgi:hypothetical protein